MLKQKQAGAAFGNPDIVTVQKKGVHANAEKSEALARQIAEVLRECDPDGRLTLNQVAMVLNDRGLRTGHGKE